MRHLYEIRLAAAITLGCVMLTACQREQSLELPAVEPLDVPALPGAALPHAASADGSAILSWVEPAGGGHRLRFAQWDGRAWTGPRVVAEGEDWFVNWADFPSVVALAGDDLAGHWLQRSAGGTYAYDVMVSRSNDGGATWSEPMRPHTDGTATEHGFVSMFPVDSGVGIVWLDGRKFAGSSASNEMTLRFTTLSDAAGSQDRAGVDSQEPEPAHPGAIRAVRSHEAELDGRACDCCQTAAALTTHGPLVAYRDRSPDEVRDISVVRWVDGEWSVPYTLHDDEWQIDACPVNGPQADAEGDDVVIAWFTAARDTPQVRAAFSTDAGATFDAPIRVDGGNPLGRVDVLLLDDARALVLWLERTADGAAVNARIVSRDGRTGETEAVARTLAQRPSGFPRMARYPGGVLLAWTEPGDTSRVRAATLDLSAR